ncbi:hypothetical protein DPEC_G00139680 [Dallia pectoralis]|uniref:Uncharacterized protein n=1 Tax=Dallia pectoralis TaxID=75939 RepID=A0ACC2GMT0_DALPE|nr:hypothetical protein DPEC_G00139680 [Dallia pectoralis]
MEYLGCYAAAEYGGIVRREVGVTCLAPTWITVRFTNARELRNAGPRDGYKLPHFTWVQLTCPGCSSAPVLLLNCESDHMRGQWEAFLALWLIDTSKPLLA